jgi:hypothetical protein
MERGSVSLAARGERTGRRSGSHAPIRRAGERSRKPQRTPGAGSSGTCSTAGRAARNRARRIPNKGCCRSFRQSTAAPDRSGFPTGTS